MKILLAGATGYIGRRLKNRLLEEKGVSLRLLVRDARQLSESTRRNVEIIEGDIHNVAVARKAVEGVEVVYYPIRLMGALWELDFDRTAVERFRDICIDAGVKRLIFMGLHVANRESLSGLKSVVETGQILSACPKDLRTIWLRVGVLLGSGSVLFELLRNIVQKIPLIVISPWMKVRLSYVSIDDVIEYLIRAMNIEVKDNLIIDIGTDDMTFQDMLKVAAKVMGLRRVFVSFPLIGQWLSSFLLMLATPFSFSQASALIEALEAEEIASASARNGAADHYFTGITPLFYRRALEKAIFEIEKDQVTSRWVDTLGKTFSVSSEDEIARAIYRDIRSMRYDVPPEKIFRAIKSIGGRTGWFTFDFLWRIRGMLDKLAGGYGTAMGKRTLTDLRVGDLLDVWKVVDLQENRRLLLESQMKVFGKAWLEFKVEGNTLIQVASHYPRGILGRVYWYSMFPFHALIFRDMIRSIIKRAQEIE